MRCAEPSLQRAGDPLPLHSRDARPPNTQKITGVCTEVSSRPVMCSATARGDGERRGPGRPRKWADEAERKRAYRARLDEDLAEPQRLRAELRQERASNRRLKQELSRAQRALAKSDAALARERAARAQLEDRIGLLGEQVAFWQRRGSLCIAAFVAPTRTPRDVPGDVPADAPRSLGEARDVPGRLPAIPHRGFRSAPDCDRPQEELAGEPW